MGKATAMAEIEIIVDPPRFKRWGPLLALIRGAFDTKAGRIDPPSSADRLTEESLAREVSRGPLILACEGVELLGCLLAREEGRALYLGKLAVVPERQGEGIARRLVEAAVAEARARRLDCLELSTRVELLENHRAFACLGFDKVGEKAHPGYDRVTSYLYRRAL